MSKINFPYKWYLKDGYPSKNIDNHKLKVFSTFLDKRLSQWAIN